MIRLEAVSASVPSGEPGHPPREIFRRLDARFAPGESHLILGRNGSGKTTFVRILAGLSAPSGGRVVWNESDATPVRPASAPALARATPWPRVAVLLEEPDPQLLTDSVSAEIAFGLESLSLTPREVDRRVGEAMERFGLSGIEGSSPRELSAGEKARVLLGAAWAGRPRALLLDQTLVHLDRATRKALERDLVAEALAGERVLVRTHQGEDPPWRGERLQVLDGGALRDPVMLPPEEILSLTAVPLPLALRVSASLARRGRIGGGLAVDPETLRRSLAGIRPDVRVIGGARGAEAGRLSRRGGHARRDGTRATLLSFEGVSWGPRKSRSPDNVVRSFDLEIRAGETVALVGRSGCGKTTVLKLAAGLLDPHGGRIRTPRSGTPSGVILAMEYPERQLFGRTVLEDVGLSLWVRGVAGPERRERARRAMERIGLDPGELGERAPTTLSEGEKRRAALASILVEPAPVLLLDEPTAGLDPEGRRALARAVDGLRCDGRAILMASHDLDFVSAVADRVLVMGPAGEAASSILGEGAPPALWRDRDLLERGGMATPEFVEVEEILRESGLLAESEARDAESLLRALDAAFEDQVGRQPSLFP